MKNTICLWTWQTNILDHSFSSVQAIARIELEILSIQFTLMFSDVDSDGANNAHLRCSGTAVDLYSSNGHAERSILLNLLASFERIKWNFIVSATKVRAV